MLNKTNPGDSSSRHIRSRPGSCDFA
jgi:hypothetical protein